ncbi:MAG: glycosyltransferase [Anaerolineales bacterium]|nr:glycosyltransferase [Anaerolineales bacterium]
MRILQVTSHQKAGGAAWVADALQRAYREKGHVAEMAVGFKYSRDPQVYEIPNNAYRRMWPRFWRGVADAGYKARLPLLPRFSRALAAWGEPQRTARLNAGYEDFDYPGTAHLLDLSPERPEIVHAHNLHGGYFDLRQLPNLSKQVPFVLTLHDAWLLSGHCSHSFGCERWLDGCGACPDLNIYPAIPVDNTVENWQIKAEIYARSRLYVAAPCRWLMDKIERSMLVGGIVDRRVIYNGIDLSVFQPGDKIAARRELGLPPDVPIVLFVGAAKRDDTFKDYATMQTALAKLAQCMGSDELLLLCLGEEGKTERIGRASVRFLGRINDRQQVARTYQAADVYLHAARAETFPNTILEALACGLPVVASAVAGIPEQVDAGENGFLAPVGDADAMAAQMAQLFENAELRQKMGANAADKARVQFGLQRMADDYLDWFREILEHAS